MFRTRLSRSSPAFSKSNRFPVLPLLDLNSVISKPHYSKIFPLILPWEMEMHAARHEFTGYRPVLLLYKTCGNFNTTQRSCIWLPLASYIIHSTYYCLDGSGISMLKIRFEELTYGMISRVQLHVVAACTCECARALSNFVKCEKTCEKDFYFRSFFHMYFNRSTDSQVSKKPWACEKTC